MDENDLIKDIPAKNQKLVFIRKYFLNKYTITIVLFLAWMIFFDKTSFLVIHEINGEISKYEDQLDYYKTEYKKNDDFYKKLMNNKSEKEKYARENYFMKKPNEEIFSQAAEAAMKDARVLEHNKFKVALGKNAIVRALNKSVKTNKA